MEYADVEEELPVAGDRTEDMPGLEENEEPILIAKGTLVPLLVREPFAMDHQVGNQRCVHSLGCLKKPSPYWIATGLQ